MLITGVREFHIEIGGTTICTWCNQKIYAPPVILVGDYKMVPYHVKCIMQLVYGALADISGYWPELPGQPITPAEKPRTTEE